MSLVFLLLPLLAGAGVAQGHGTPAALAKIPLSKAAEPVEGATAPRVATFIVERRVDRVVGGAAAMMRARLAVVGNCVLVQTESGKEVVPVFSAGTASWDPEARQLRYQNQRYSIGNVVSIGGGGVNPAMIPTLIRSPLVDFPSDCPRSELWFTAG